MLNDIFLGIKDVLKSKFIVLLYSIFFSFIMFITISSTKSLVTDISYQSNEIDKTYNTFYTYIIGLKLDNARKTIKDLSLLFKSNSFTFCNAIISTENNENLDTYLLFGKVPDSYTYLKGDNDINIFVGKDCAYVKYIYLNNVKYYVNSIINDENSFYVSPTQIENTNNKVFVVIKNPTFPDWILNSNDEIFYQLVKNTHILKSDKPRTNQFIKLTNSDFLKVISNDMQVQKIESNFIVKIIYPFIIIMLLCSYLASSLIIDGMIKKRVREFSVYIIHGARVHNLIVRLSTYFFVIINISLFLCIELKFISLSEINYYVIMGFFINIAYVLIITRKVQNKNLFKNLRNGAGI